MKRALFDTSIALRIFDEDDPHYGPIAIAVDRLIDEGYEMFFAPQVTFEARVVLTRPKSDNGQNRSAKEFGDLVERMSLLATFLPDPPDLVGRWMRLCSRHDIVGKRSHDVRLVAWMEAHGVDTILTLNPRDFLVFDNITVLAP